MTNTPCLVPFTYALRRETAPGVRPGMAGHFHLRAQMKVTKAKGPMQNHAFAPALGHGGPAGILSRAGTLDSPVLMSTRARCALPSACASRAKRSEPASTCEPLVRAFSFIIESPPGRCAGARGRMHGFAFRPSSLLPFFWANGRKGVAMPGRIPGGLSRGQQKHRSGAAR